MLDRVSRPCTSWVTIAIGLLGRQARANNSKDYLIAGRKLPLYMSAATVFRHLVRRGDGAFRYRRFSRATASAASSADPFGSTFCLVLVALFFAQPLLTAWTC